MGIIGIVSFICILIDRISKIIFTNIGSVSVIDNFFNITVAHNTGAAWSILSGYRIFLICLSIFELFIVYNVFIKGQKLNKRDNIVLGILIGGILGNLIDRIVYGYVIDFLDFKIFGYNFPIFNLADSMIVISVILLIYLICKGDMDDSR